MAKQLLKVKFFTQPRYTRRVFEMLSKYLETMISNKTAYREIMVALGEAMDNAIMHGNQLVAERYIELECEIEDNRFACYVQDEGKGFNYKKYMADSLVNFTPEALMKKVTQFGTPGSMGIAMMRKCMNEVTFNDAGNRLILVKHF